MFYLYYLEYPLGVYCSVTYIHHFFLWFRERAASGEMRAFPHHLCRATHWGGCTRFRAKAEHRESDQVSAELEAHVLWSQVIILWTYMCTKAHLKELAVGSVSDLDHIHPGPDLTKIKIRIRTQIRIRILQITKYIHIFFKVLSDSLKVAIHDWTLRFFYLS